MDFTRIKALLRFDQLATTSDFTIPQYWEITPRPNIHPSYDAIQKRALAETIRVLGDNAENIALHGKDKYALFWSLFAPNTVADWKLQLAVRWYHWVCGDFAWVNSMAKWMALGDRIRRRL